MTTTTTAVRPTGHAWDDDARGYATSDPPALPCGHHGPTNRPCPTCAVFADTPNDDPM